MVQNGCINPGDKSYHDILRILWTPHDLLTGIIPLFKIAGIKLSQNALQFMNNIDKYIINEDYTDNEEQKDILTRIELTSNFIRYMLGYDDKYIKIKDEIFFIDEFFLISIALLKAVGWSVNQRDLDLITERINSIAIDAISTQEKQETFIDDMIDAINNIEQLVS